MTDFFTWLLATIKGGLQWIKDGLGITKREEEAKLAKTGASIGKAHGNVDAKGQGTPYEWMTTEAGTGWFPKGTSATTKGIAPNEGLSADEVARLNRGKEAVDKAPKSFFEAIPGIANLTIAIGKLIDALAPLGKGTDDKGLPIRNDAANQAIAGAFGYSAANKNVMGDNGIQWTRDKNTGDIKAYDYESGLPIANPGDIPEATQKAFDADPWVKPKMDRGGSIIGSGAIIGHKGEQVNPADVVLGGETTLEKINKMFSGAAGSGGGQTIHAPISLTVVIEKVEKAVDVDQIISRIGNEGADKLLFALRNKMENGSTRGIGYLRG
jgi:hypothetical protein